MPKAQVPIAPLGLRVLVVEDEAFLRWSVVQTLSTGPHTMLEAPDAQSALRLIGRAGPLVDVVLLDYRLLDSQDLRLLSRIRQASPHSAVVMMTAFDAREMVAEALALGAYAVLGKPFENGPIGALALPGVRGTVRIRRCARRVAVRAKQENAQMFVPNFNAFANDGTAAVKAAGPVA